MQRTGDVEANTSVQLCEQAEEENDVGKEHATNEGGGQKTPFDVVPVLPVAVDVDPIPFPVDTCEHLH
eukprot:2133661-Prorocentrum_lima.AAC.1